MLRDKDGGMLITIPKARRAKDGTIPFAERPRLADTLGIPAPCAPLRTSNLTSTVSKPSPVDFATDFLIAIEAYSSTNVSARTVMAVPSSGFPTRIGLRS
ncbi:hypothetical protein [Rhodococcus pyridinivorans]|uniref:hypothetical protein n=1 Tax=Rhodococcus pyridinivorans TaxID=103816 RepID=UPI00110ED360|nr:hypothetical protein [Rhodococcus pyridinivorans]